MKTTPFSGPQPWKTSLTPQAKGRQGLEQLSNELGQSPTPQDTVVTSCPNEVTVRPPRSLTRFLKVAIPLGVGLGVAAAAAAGIASVATPAVVVGAACIAAGGALGGMARSTDVNFAPLGGAMIGGVAAIALGCPLVESVVTLMICGGAGLMSGLLAGGVVFGSGGGRHAG